jgi:protein-tyrosine phosphatase
MNAARHWKIDLSSHVTTDISVFEARAGDLLLAMEPRQVRRLVANPRVAALPTSLLGLWSSPVRPHIHDPYGLGDDYFSNCFAVIVSAIDRLAAQCVNARGTASGR